uniref:Uncharacterized protein n=1 Tax=Ciona intestinalis TaxID=7719 RepID=H2XZP8_CIOIN
MQVDWNVGSNRSLQPIHRKCLTAVSVIGKCFVIYSHDFISQKYK